ncbi:hypothetical protein ADUPG1_014266, partial [Aduncisulcus paluster]
IELSLPRCELGDSVRDLLEFLQDSCEKLQVLDIAGNKITDKCVQGVGVTPAPVEEGKEPEDVTLFKFFRQPHPTGLAGTLRKVSLGFNMFSSMNAVGFVKACVEGGSCVCVDMSGITFSPVSTSALVDVYVEKEEPKVEEPKVEETTETTEEENKGTEDPQEEEEKKEEEPQKVEEVPKKEPRIVCVSELIMRECGIDAKCVPIMCPMISSGLLTGLDLSDNKIGKSSPEVVKCGITGSVKVLMLRNNKIAAAQANDVYNLFKQEEDPKEGEEGEKKEEKQEYAIQHLDLSENKLGAVKDVLATIATGFRNLKL